MLLTTLGIWVGLNEAQSTVLASIFGRGFGPLLACNRSSKCLWSRFWASAGMLLGVNAWQTSLGSLKFQRPNL